MKSLEAIEQETSVEAIINAQKCVHLDTAGRGNHVPRAHDLCIELGIKPNHKNLAAISVVLVNFEDERMTAVREAQRSRLEMVKRRLKQFK